MDDIPHADETRTLIKDIWDIRISKLRSSIDTFVKSDATHAKVLYEPRRDTTGRCENKNAYQLCGNREADQRLCFRYTDSTIPLLPKSEISRL